MIILNDQKALLDNPLVSPRIPLNGIILLVRCGNKAYNRSHMSRHTSFKLLDFQLRVTDHVILSTEDICRRYYPSSRRRRAGLVSLIRSFCAPSAAVELLLKAKISYDGKCSVPSL